MLFNTIQSLIFFQIVIATYFALPHKFRWFFLLIASCYFYTAFIPIYILILLVLILIDYFAAILIERSQNSARKFILILSLTANLSILFFFKYATFLSSNLTRFGHFLGWPVNYPSLEIILPIGLLRSPLKFDQ